MTEKRFPRTEVQHDLEHFIDTYKCETFYDFSVMCKDMSNVARGSLDYADDFEYDEETKKSLKKIVELSHELSKLWMSCDEYYRAYSE